MAVTVMQARQVTVVVPDGDPDASSWADGAGSLQARGSGAPVRRLFVDIRRSGAPEESGLLVALLRRSPRLQGVVANCGLGRRTSPLP